MEFLENNLTIRITNCTDETNLVEVSSLFVSISETSAIRASFYTDNITLWAFVIKNSAIDVFRFNMSTDIGSEFVYTINSTGNGGYPLNPVSVAFYNNTGIYCDSKFGAYVFSLDFLYDNPPEFPILQKIFSASKIGNITSCTVNDDYLTVDTLNGTAVYQLPSLARIILYPFNSSKPVLPVYGMISNSNFTVGYVATQVKTSKTISSVISFRVYATMMSYTNSLLIDYNLKVFLQGDITNTLPSFALYQLPDQTNPYSFDTYLIVNAGLNLFVYLVQPGAYLTFPAQSVAYTYNGNILVNNGAISKTYPIKVTGVSKNSTVIYPIKGLYPTEGYAVSTSYSNYLLATNNSVYYSYIPVSNYFVGANVTFSLSIFNGTNNYDNLTYTLPSKSSVFSMIDYAAQADPQVSMKVYSIFGGDNIDYVIMVSGNQVSIMVYAGSSYMSNITISIPLPLSPSLAIFRRVINGYLLVESTEVLTDGTYQVVWQIYNISFAKNTAVLISTTTNLDRTPSYKIQYYNGNFFSLYGNSIDIWAVNNKNGVVTMNYTTTISSETIYPATSFIPSSFIVARNLIYAYDTVLGLMSFYISSIEPHSRTIYNISLASTFYVEMESNNNNLLVFAKNVTANIVYLMPLSNVSAFSIRPLIHCSIPVSISLSGSFYSILCVNGINFYAQIFDLNAQTYSSLFTEIYPGFQGPFALGAIYASQSGAGYFTDGKTVSAYSIGQKGDSTWSPTYPVQAILPGDESVPVWARINLEFIDVIYQPTYYIQLLLTASNIYMNLSQVINYTVDNTANYIAKNPSFNITDSNFTYGQILLYDESYSAPIPLQAFQGNDIDFAFQVNGTLTGYDVPATEVCEENKTTLFCLENKTYEYLTEGYLTYDFDISGNLMVTTNRTSATLYDFSTTAPVTTTIVWENDLTVTMRCFYVRYLPGDQAFAISCINITGNGYNPYIVIYSYDSCTSQVFKVSNPTQWMTVSVYDNITYLYQYEGTTLSILEITYTNDTNGCSYEFTLIGQITQNSLSVNTFDALNMAQINSTMAVIGETYLGLIFVNINVTGNTNTYTLNSTYLPVSSILQAAASTAVCMNLLSDLNTILLVTNLSEVYKISASNLKILTTYPKVLLDGSASNNQICGVNEETTMIGFAVYNPGVVGVIRLLNYTANPSSAIYKDRVLTNNSTSNYPSRIVFNGTTVLHNLSPSNSSATNKPVHFVKIRTNPMGYVYKSNLLYNGSVALVAYSTEDAYQFAPIRYYVNPIPPEEITIDTTDFYRSDWNRWYFWLILGLFSLVLVTSIISIYTCIKKNKDRRSSSALDIGLTTVNP